MKTQTINVVFDGPPGPVCGRFVEVEDVNGNSIISGGEWVDHPTQEGWACLQFEVVVPE